MVTRIVAGAGFAAVWSLVSVFFAKYELNNVYKKLISSEKTENSETKIEDKSFTKKQMYIFGGIIMILNILLSVVLMYIYKDTPIIEHVKRLGLIGIVEVAAITDKRYNRIPNDLIIAGLILRAVILVAEIFKFKMDVISILVSDVMGMLIVVLIVVLCLLFMKGSIGMGDLKIMMLMAICQGVDGFTASGMLSLLAAFFVAVYYLVTKKKSRKDSMPFGPFLAVGTYLGIFLTGL